MKQLILVLALLLGSLFCRGSDTLSIFDHFNQDSILRITMETDLKQLIKKKFKEDYQEARLTYHKKDGTPMQHHIKVRTRGNARKSICYFPPLKLKFPKKNLEMAGMHREMNKLKLVCQCRQGEVSAQYVLKEYLAYRLFSVMTDISFRVQLTKITFVDNENQKKSFDSFGFLIESTDQLNYRFQGIKHSVSNLSPKHTVPEQTDLLHLFQYMIGNTDWSIRKSHNIYSFRTPQYAKPICVPYDFDYAGIVNTNYAIPEEHLFITEVTERLFRGICRPSGTYEQVAQLFVDKKIDLYEVVTGFPYLNKRERIFVMNYLDSFFKIIENPKVLENSVINNCR